MASFISIVFVFFSFILIDKLLFIYFPEHEATRAQADVQQAQAPIDRLEAEIRAARETLQKHRTERDQLQTRLAAAQARKQKQVELLDSLKRALAEADKAVQLAPGDQELATARSGFQTRLTAATETLAGLDRELAELTEPLADANDALTDLRARVAALSNRRLALGVFVVEARGVQRRVHARQQALADTLSDLVVQRQRWTELRDWLVLRADHAAPESAGPASEPQAPPGAAEREERLRLREAELIASWRRGFALRGIRGLSPEQMAASVVGSLGLDRPIRARLVAEWQAANPGQPADLAQLPDLRQKIEVHIADQVWNVEDEIAERFGAPPGTPQDSFFATTEQAL
ncbi:MAG: hypothetical protein ACKOFW_22580, partial [Planctomycetaceae bacterium]